MKIVVKIELERNQTMRPNGVGFLGEVIINLETPVDAVEWDNNKFKG